MRYSAGARIDRWCLLDRLVGRLSAVLPRGGFGRLARHGRLQTAARSRHNASCFGKPQLNLWRANAKLFLIESSTGDAAGNHGGGHGEFLA